jgi:transposase-like protein
MTKGKYYTPEFKEQAVKMVVESAPSRTTGSVARELEVNETTLGCWATAYRKKMKGQPLPATMPDGDRLRELAAAAFAGGLVAGRCPPPRRLPTPASD